MMDKKVEAALGQSTECVRESAEERCLEQFESLSGRCDSVIEQMLAAALPGRMSHEVEYGVPIIYHHRGFTHGEEPLAPWDYVAAFAQAKVRTYRADFLFDVRAGEERFTLVVECDGHDYHERTKEQAERDRSRDRWMMAQAIHVMRFTGREIVRDPQDCADQIHTQLVRLLEQALGI